MQTLSLIKFQLFLCHLCNFYGQIKLVELDWMVVTSLLCKLPNYRTIVICTIQQSSCTLLYLILKYNLTWVVKNKGRMYCTIWGFIATRDYKSEQSHGITSNFKKLYFILISVQGCVLQGSWIYNILCTLIHCYCIKNLYINYLIRPWSNYIRYIYLTIIKCP